MANRNFSKVQALSKEIKIIAGRFDDADVKVSGIGYSAANSGTGVYTITLEDKYFGLIAINANVQCTSGTDDYVVSVISEDVDGVKTIVLHVAVAGVLTDLGTGDEIHFSAFLHNSSLPIV